jgi:hypothetical protein
MNIVYNDPFATENSLDSFSKDFVGGYEEYE